MSLTRVMIQKKALMRLFALC
uniref:Uncharacterized protein n=1 Tax=Fusarium oxysporum (strain Fo5176) TaxID=660025 RepID=A0A0D2XAY5_FUSOF